jgi:CBS domain-containing protein
LLILNKRIISLQFLTFFNFKEGIMQVKKIMTKNPACCTSDSTLQEVAHMMEMYDCGCIPVVADHQSKRPIGTVTDRDITVRTFSAGKNPLEMKASDIMTTDIATVTPDTSLDQCLNVMENRQIRRILVVDKNNRCVGIVAQADLAEHGTNQAETMEFIREVSESEADRVHETNYESNRSLNNQRRNRQDNHSFSQNQSFGRSRQSYRKQFVEKESFFNSSNLLTLLGTIGLGAGLSYYFGIGGGAEQPTKKTKTQHLDTKISTGKKTDHLLTVAPATPAHKTTTMPGAATTDRTETRDTISGTVSSFNKTNDDDDLKPITEVGRTATNT